MAYIICEPCLDTCDTACVEVCPVDCIYTEPGWSKGDDAKGHCLYIHPEECIDCDACKPECPVEAIFAEEDTPEDQQAWIAINADYFEKDEDEQVGYGAKHWTKPDA